MSRTREEILSDIKHYTKWAENYTKQAEEFKQELKEFDEAQNEQN